MVETGQFNQQTKEENGQQQNKGRFR